MGPRAGLDAVGNIKLRANVKIASVSIEVSPHDDICQIDGKDLYLNLTLDEGNCSAVLHTLADLHPGKEPTAHH
jgi:hypothetical protein